MPLIEWKEELCIGIDVIDKQHQTIAEYVNEFATAIEQKADNTHELLVKLVDYTKFHFTTEEQYFSCLSKEDKLLHKLQHKHIAEELEELVKRDAAESLTDEVYHNLVDWFVIHIECEDSKLTAKFKEKSKSALESNNENCST